jgi:hypothetical protein
MRMGLRDIDWSQVGAQLAQSGSDEQTEFFKSFVKECLTWGTNHQVEQQLAAVNVELTVEERRVLSMLGFDSRGLG